MDMKRIIMATALLTIITGGEVNALASKPSVAKITHVKVSRNKVTGYTTAKSHIELLKLKHGEKSSGTANKNGKFTVKVKSNNLIKLKFKIKATKPGMKARIYTHKVKKNSQIIDNSTMSPSPAPAKPDEGKKPEPGLPSNSNNPQLPSQPHKPQPTEADIKAIKEKIELAKQDYIRIKNANQSDIEALKDITDHAESLRQKWNEARLTLVNATPDCLDEAQKALETAQMDFENYVNSDTYKTAFKKMRQAQKNISSAAGRVYELANLLEAMQPDAPYYGYLDF